MLFSISPQDFRRLERFLPKGLAGDAEDGPLERAAGQLARLVLTQQLMPGHKIPMDAIADRIGASRTPVREALRLLETEGLVAQVPNRGFIVRRLDPVETGHLYDARRCIERFLAGAAYARKKRAFVQDLRALHRIYEEVLGAETDRRRLGMLVDKAFHLRIAEQAANPHLTRLLGNVFDRLILTRPLEGFPVHRKKTAVDEHAQIVAAFEAGPARAVEEAVVANVDRGCTAIVAHMQLLDREEIL